MQRPRSRSILFWTLLLSGLGAGSLLASVRSAWVQDRLFGPTPPEPFGVMNSPVDVQRWILSTFDTEGEPRLEDRCTIAMTSHDGR